MRRCAFGLFRFLRLIRALRPGSATSATIVSTLPDKREPAILGIVPGIEFHLDTRTVLMVEAETGAQEDRKVGLPSEPIGRDHACSPQKTGRRGIENMRTCQEQTVQRASVKLIGASHRAAIEGRRELEKD